MSNLDPILYTSKLTSGDGVEFLVEYSDTDSFEHLDHARCKQTYGVCFFITRDKEITDTMVIGFGGKKKTWGLIGGSIEPGETFEQTLRREIKEESNMEILAFLPIGYQKVTDIKSGKMMYQLRYACRVKPLGPFVIDGGDGMSEKGITEIKLINPADYKEYFDWGDIGEHIIKRAVGLQDKLQEQIDQVK